MAAKWYTREILGRLENRLETRMQKATLAVYRDVRVAINRGNPDGDNPSLPGEPPKKVSGRLFQSITTKVLRARGDVIGLVGTDAPYAPRLEYGFVGRDQRGRIIDQAPRPFLRPALFQNKGAIVRILGGS